MIRRHVERSDAIHDPASALARSAIAGPASRSTLYGLVHSASLISWADELHFAIVIKPVSQLHRLRADDSRERMYEHMPVVWHGLCCTGQTPERAAPHVESRPDEHTAPATDNSQTFAAERKRSRNRQRGALMRDACFAAHSSPLARLRLFVCCDRAWRRRPRIPFPGRPNAGWIQR